MKSKKILLTIIVLIIVLCAVILGTIAYCFPIKYKDSIIETSAEFDLSPVLVASVINAESRFRADAISQKGAVGLMQLLPSTAAEIAQKLGIQDFTEKDLFTPKTNIRLGTSYLSYLINEFDNVDTALCAYNAGPNKVRSWLNNPKYSEDGKSLTIIPYAETQKYVKKISFYTKFYAGYF